jgi:RND family efflux transporter MFP subunit
MTMAKTRSMVWVGSTLLIMFLVLLAIGVLPRMRSHRALAMNAEQVKNAKVRLVVVKAKTSTDSDLSLAASTQAFQDAVVYARTNGYVTQRYVDIGDTVKRGQVLAEIASPEVDQQLRQAQAELRSALKTVELQSTSLALARSTQERYRAADSGRAVAKQAVDQSVAATKTAASTVAAARANVESQRANVQRLQELAGFEKITAPFDGTVVRRNVDVGALITAGSPTTNSAGATGMFEIAQIDVLRVFFTVPQVHAPSVKVGLPVTITARSHLGKPVEATITRTASALDPQTRTLLVEVDVQNDKHELMPGMFAYVAVKLSPLGKQWSVPATAVIVDTEGTRVITVTAEHKVHYQAVQLGRDFGESIEIQNGLDGHESIVRQPTVALEEGQSVETVTQQPAKG